MCNPLWMKTTWRCSCFNWLAVCNTICLPQLTNTHRDLTANISIAFTFVINPDSRHYIDAHQLHFLTTHNPPSMLGRSPLLVVFSINIITTLIIFDHSPSGDNDVQWDILSHCYSFCFVLFWIITLICSIYVALCTVFVLCFVAFVLVLIGPLKFPLWCYYFVVHWTMNNGINHLNIS